MRTFSPIKTLWRCVALGLCALAACSRDQPTAPSGHTITGHLRLTGYLTDGNGTFLGTRVMGDADGVPVELLHGSAVVARTTTVDGIYRFDGLKSGDYVARSQVIGDIGDQTNPMVIAGSNVACADTLRLASRGELFASPNPFVDTVQVSFVLNDTTSVDFNVTDVAGQRLRNLVTLRLRPEQYVFHWDGRDLSGQPAAGSLFWVTYTGDRHLGTLDVRALLLFR